MTTPGAQRPRVVVLMATYNGGQWIEQQVDSILSQEDVDVRLLISDDGSTDHTRDILEDYSRRDSRVTLLPRRKGPAGVAANFLHLFMHADIDKDEYIAFSDQDDLWIPNKLRHQIQLIKKSQSGVVSSDVLSFNRRGSFKAIIKSQPQRRWDYIFEAGGPGSTYVFSPSVHRELCAILTDIGATGISVHDWYLYALARARGVKWTIDSRPTVLYRQHDANVIGANSGFNAISSRLKKLRSGHYREQFLRIAQASLKVGAPYQSVEWQAELSHIIACLSSPSRLGRISMLPLTFELRRRRSQALSLMLLGILGIW